MAEYAYIYMNVYIYMHVCSFPTHLEQIEVQLLTAPERGPVLLAILSRFFRLVSGRHRALFVVYCELFLVSEGDSMDDRPDPSSGGIDTLSAV
jgi:hypothetical protein